MSDLQIGAPRRTLCERCTAPVLEAAVAPGLKVLVEVRESLPRERCRTCLSGRLLHERCWRCGAQPWEGEERRYVGVNPAELMGVTLDERGRAHIFLGRERQEGEALHRPHRCGVIWPELVVPVQPPQRQLLAA